MCTANFNEAKASESFGNFKEYANSKDGQAEIAVGGVGLTDSINSYFDAKASNAYADYQRNILLSNSQALETSSRDVIESGRDQIAWLGYQGKAEQASVTNDQSYRGIDTNVGSAKTYRQGLQKVNQINIENTRYNAMLQSFGLQTKALQAKHQSEATQLNKKNEWAGVLISLGKTAMSVYSMGAGGAGTGANSGGN